MDEFKKDNEFPSHLRVVLAIFRAAETCRRENNALRNILHKQGLSDAAIRGRVRRLLYPFINFR